MPGGQPGGRGQGAHLPVAGGAGAGDPASTAGGPGTSPPQAAAPWRGRGGCTPASTSTGPRGPGQTAAAGRVSWPAGTTASASTSASSTPGLLPPATPTSRRSWSIPASGSAPDPIGLVVGSTGHLATGPHPTPGWSATRRPSILGASSDGPGGASRSPPCAWPVPPASQHSPRSARSHEAPGERPSARLGPRGSPAGQHGGPGTPAAPRRRRSANGSSGCGPGGDPQRSPRHAARIRLPEEDLFFVQGYLHAVPSVSSRWTSQPRGPGDAWPKPSVSASALAGADGPVKG